VILKYVIQGEKKEVRTKKENMNIPAKEDLRKVLKVCDPL